MLNEQVPTYFGMSLEQYAISLRDESNTLRNENLALKQELQAMQGKYGLPNYSLADIHKELDRRLECKLVGAAVKARTR